MRKMLSFFIVFFLLPFFTAYAEDLVIAWPVNAGPLNPHTYAPNQMYAQVLVYDSLVRYGANGIIEPSLAESWSVSDDGRIYSFRMRKNARFSDGTPVNAEAVVMNFDAVVSNKARHAWVGLTEKIDSYRAAGSDIFVLILKSPYAAALEELSLPRPFRILAPSGFDSVSTYKGIKKPVGSGPWRIEESRLGEYDIFARNEFYWGEKPAFDRLIVKVLPDPNSRVLALETEAVDMLIGEGVISLENFVRLGKNDKFEAVKSGPQQSNVIVINAGADKLTGDKAVRKALLHAVNRQVVVKGVLLDVEAPAETLFMPGLKFCGTKLEPYGFDPALSEKLLDEAGWKKDGNIRKKNGRPLEISLYYIGTDPRQKAVGEVIQGDLAKIGVKLLLKAQEEISFYQAQKTGAFDLIFNSTWGAPFDPHSFLSSMRASSHADYAAQKDLPEKAAVDKAINSILGTADETALKKYYDYVLTALHESGVYMPISYGVNTAVYNKSRVGGFTFGEMKTEFMFHKMKPAEAK